MNRFFPTDSNVASFDRDRYLRFQAAYLAVCTNLHVTHPRKDDRVFTFEGHEFVIAYASYLLEYLDGKLGGGS